MYHAMFNISSLEIAEKEAEFAVVNSAIKF